MKEWKVLQPIQIGNIEVKNRVSYLAMAKFLATPDGEVTDRQVAFYEGLAKGGAGLIIPGALNIDPDWPSYLKCQPNFWDDKYIDGVARIVDACHKHGAKVLLQPWHPGEVDYVGNGTPKITDLTVEEIHKKQQLFVDAAVRCQKAGADGIEFQICHNYLACCFFTPGINKRTDQYGCDTMENSLRFSLESIGKIQQACGRDFPITVKLQGFDGKFEGGITPERAAEAAPWLEKAGVAMISVSAGGKTSGTTLMSADGRQPEGWKVMFAEAVKRAVSIPVCATGSIRHLEYVEELLEQGKCDMVGIGRGLIAEPNWIRKVEEGREDEMRHCVSCLHCMTAMSGPEITNCTVNPLALREILGMDELRQDGGGRTVAIVGAGPAGLEAAVTLEQRSFMPVVLESDSEIGGMARLAAVPDGKAKMNWLVDYYDGTLLFDSNLDTISKALNPKPDKIASKSIKSVRSRVTNIADHISAPMDMANFKQLLRHEMFDAR